jgi:hypothetical protein
MLCCKWWEQVLTTPSSQDPFLLWMGYRLCVLQLKCVEQLGSLIGQISAPGSSNTTRVLSVGEAKLKLSQHKFTGKTKDREYLNVFLYFVTFFLFLFYA